jgi:hypothetical protein
MMQLSGLRPLVAALGFLLLVSLVISALLRTVGRYVDLVVPFGQVILQGVNLVHPAGTGDSVCIVEASRICHSRPEISGPAFLARVGHRQSMTTDRQSKGRRSDAGTQGFTDSIVV